MRGQDYRNYSTLPQDGERDAGAWKAGCHHARADRDMVYWAPVLPESTKAQAIRWNKKGLLAKAVSLCSEPHCLSEHSEESISPYLSDKSTILDSLFQQIHFFAFWSSLFLLFHFERRFYKFLFWQKTDCLLYIFRKPFKQFMPMVPGQINRTFYMDETFFLWYYLHIEQCVFI